MRRISVLAALTLVAGLVTVVGAGPAFASTTITTPASDGFAVPGDTSHNPLPFNVVATGYTPGASVFVTVCDGLDPSDPNWSVSVDCDFGTAPGPVTADGSGVATFSGSHQLQTFKDGLDAQGKFNCLGTTDPPLNNGLTNWRTCRIRVSTNNSSATADQAFRTFVNPSGPPTVPQAPSGVTATGHPTSASVSFTAPFDGGSAITGYHASCTSSNSGVSGSNAGASSPIVVSALTAGKTYTCTVTATNSVGTGPASAPSNSFVVPTAPGAPTGVVAKSGSTTTTTGSLVVTYAAPANNGGSAITQFTATCTSSNSGVTKTGTHAGATAVAITVAAVTTAKTYTCKVTATNVVGTSLPSAASLAVIVGSPAPPSGVAAKSASTTTTTGSLVVTFTIGSNNGSAITSQTATCTSTNGGVAKTGTHTGATAAPITVAGVTTAKTYTCTVASKNARGAGLASPPSLAVIVGSPAPPTGVSAAHVASGQIKVTFTLGANNGSAIQSQTATCTSSNGGATNFATHTGATAAPITVTALTVGKLYTCKVTAKNARGTGLASAASNAVTA